MKKNAVRLLGVFVDIFDLNTLICRVDHVIKNSERHKIMHVNVHTLNITYKDEDCKKALINSDMVYCDGDGVRFGARFMGFNIPEKITGADWIYNLCELCEEKGYTIYLLGGEPGVAQNASRFLLNKYPKLRIVGSQHGYFEKYGEKNDIVVAEINNKSPDILLVGFGTPIQEKWIDKNFEELNAHVVWAMGAVMDYVTGRVSRAPQWMRTYGLEWFYRLIIEPRRMWRRYLIGNIIFIYRVMKETIYYGLFTAKT